MANAYHLMRSYYKHMGYPMTIDHWTFQADCGWGLMDPEKYWPTRKRRIGAAVENVSPAPPPRLAPVGPRRPKFTEKALAPEGALKRRLDSSLRHFPVALNQKEKGSVCCQLHRFAHKWVNKNSSKPAGSRSDVYTCGDCGVALCVQCWEVFHTTKCFVGNDYQNVLGS